MIKVCEVDKKISDCRPSEKPHSKEFLKLIKKLKKIKNAPTINTALKQCYQLEISCTKLKYFLLSSKISWVED